MFLNTVAVISVYCTMASGELRYTPAHYFQTKTQCQNSWAFTKEYGSNINCSRYSCVPETITVQCEAGNTSWMCT